MMKLEEIMALLPEVVRSDSVMEACTTEAVSLRLRTTEAGADAVQNKRLAVQPALKPVSKGATRVGSGRFDTLGDYFAT
jgi:hypothetical protein